MPDRYIRDEILESERFLAVDNIGKLAFFACMLTCDTVGNLDAQPLRLYRLWRDFGVGTVEASEQVLAALEAVDLVRSYPVDNKRFIHIPRFGQSRMYLGRLHPSSPWDNEKRETQRNKNQGTSRKTPEVLAENSPKTSAQLTDNSTGVGVGVGVGEGLERRGVDVQNPHSAREVEPKSKPFEIIPDQPLKTNANGNGTTAATVKGIAELAAEVGRKLTVQPGHRPHLSKAEQLAALAIMQRQRKEA